MIKSLVAGLVLLGTQLLGAQLDWSNPSTNQPIVTWQQWTNGPVLRYTAFWTPLTNLDTGTNWATTTNWQIAVDVNSSTTNSIIPTNVVFGSYMTLVMTIPGGLKTTPALTNGVPYIFNNHVGVNFTNQPNHP